MSLRKTERLLKSLYENKQRINFSNEIKDDDLIIMKPTL
jgi:hypothetical protein